MSEHKKCPFCGSLDVTARKLNTWWRIICDHCGSATGIRATELEAWAAWNRRDAAAVKELAELLKEAHEHVCDLCCPSTGKAGTPIKHGDLCKRIQQAIKEVEGL